MASLTDFQQLKVLSILVNQFAADYNESNSVQNDQNSFQGLAMSRLKIFKIFYSSDNVPNQGLILAEIYRKR